MKMSCKKLVAAIMAACMLLSMVTVASAEDQTKADKAQSILSSASYKYWTEDSVLPSDVIVQAFDGNNLFSLYWGGLFTGNNAFLEDIQKFYAMTLVDSLSLADYDVPVYSQTDIDTFTYSFNNSVVAYLGYPATDVKVGDIESAMTKVYDKYKITEGAREAIDPDLLCPDVAELTAYVSFTRDFVSQLQEDIDFMRYDTSDGNVQAALAIVEDVIDIAYANTEKYIYANESKDLEDIINNGFVAGLGAAFVEYLESNNIATDVSYNPQLTLIENFASTVDEAAKYFVAIKYAIGYEALFTSAVDDAAIALGAAVEEEDKDIAAVDVISRAGLFNGLVRYQAVLSAAFANAASSKSQEYYKFICEFLENISIADADLAKDTKDLLIPAKWSLIAKAVIDTVDASTVEMTAADFSDLLVPVSAVASAKASFTSVGIGEGTTVFITTNDYSLAYMSLTVAADGSVNIANLLPGTYGWMAGDKHGTVTISESGVATVVISDQPISSVGDSSVTETSSTTGTSSTAGSNTTNPKTGDSSTVFFAALICMAAAAAYVFTKRVRD